MDGLGWSWLRIQPEILEGWDCGLGSSLRGHGPRFARAWTGSWSCARACGRSGLELRSLGLAAGVTGLSWLTWKEQLGLAAGLRSGLEWRAWAGSWSPARAWIARAGITRADAHMEEELGGDTWLSGLG
ncbi:hypothetical protein TIFTF001_011549 [Ficus carica]|uniref:Uncharacterized protein n=1 Tax=Ficus carica TaxID=3494 RepID=A0AA87ZUB5_FICCA|nr:hypothetical protein TIFTF001_011549 [Ficus carica]